jgi:hypothetical protein
MRINYFQFNVEKINLKCCLLPLKSQNPQKPDCPYTLSVIFIPNNPLFGQGKISS